MSGQFYLLNALWFGAALVITGALLPYIWRVLRFIVIMCLPFGLVSLGYIIGDIIKATRQLRAGDDDASNTVIPINKAKSSRK